MSMLTHREYGVLPGARLAAGLGQTASYAHERIVRVPRINVQGVVQAIVELHDGSLVSAAIAVIRCTEYRHNALFVRPVISLDIDDDVS